MGDFMPAGGGGPDPQQEIDAATGPRGPGAFQHQRPGDPTSATPVTPSSSSSGPVGPPYQPSLADSTSVAPSIFDAYSGPQVDAVRTIITTYMGLLGWPQSIDTEQMALTLLQGNLENQPQTAFESLWSSKFLTDDMRKATPWARYGQNADTYHQNLISSQDSIKRLTGMDVSATGNDAMAALLQNSIKFGWSQQQLLDTLQSGSFADVSGKQTDLVGVQAAEPWLLSGQTYQQQAQQFHTIYGAAPVNTDQLAGWYRFNQSAASMGPWYARQAVVEAPGKMPTAVGQTEVR